MKQLKLSFFLFSFLVAIALHSNAAAAPNMEVIGFLDVLLFGADPTGAEDSTEAIQTAIDTAYEQQLSVFIPLGNYRISDTLTCQRVDVPKHLLRLKGCQIVGSSKDGQRPLLFLADKTSGFMNSDSPKPLIHIWTDSNGKEKPSIGFSSGIRNIAIDLGAENTGAVGYQQEGAQENVIMNLSIAANDGYAGMMSLVGTNSVLNHIEIVGGRYGIYAPEARWPTLTDITLLNQTEYAIYNYKSSGPLTIAGFQIQKATAPVIKTVGTWGDGGGNLTLIDGTIELTSVNDSPAIDNTAAKNVVLHNVYFNNAQTLIHSGDNPPVAGGGGWVHVDEYAAPHDDVGITLIDGIVDDNERIGIITVGAAPDVDLRLRHAIDEANYPSPDVILNKIAAGERVNGRSVTNVADHGIIGLSRTDADSTDAPDYGPEIQSLIESYDLLFFPAGHYPVKNTLTLQENSTLIGAGNFNTLIRTHEAWQVTETTPLISTVNSATASPRMAFLGLRWNTNKDLSLDWFEAVHWQAGKESEVVNVLMKPLWADVGEGGTFTGNSRKEIRFSDNGGGRWFGMGAFGNPNRNGHSGHRKLYIEATSEPLIIYGLNIEDGHGAYQAEIQDSSNILIIGTKTENPNDILIENSHNLIAFSWGGDHASMTFRDSSPVLGATLAPKVSDRDINVLEEHINGESYTFDSDIVVALFKRGSVNYDLFFTDDDDIPDPPAPPIPPPNITNLAPNPSFESDPFVDYTTTGQGTFKWVDNVAHTGMHSVKIRRTGSVDDEYGRLRSKTNRISVEDGVIGFTFSAWLRGRTPDGTQIVINFWDEDKTFLSAESVWVHPNKTWQQVEFSTDKPIPNDAVYVRIEFRLYGTGVLWMDDLSLLPSFNNLNSLNR